MKTELFRKTLGRFYVAAFQSETLKAFGLALSYESRDLSLDAAFGAFVLTVGVRF